LLMLRRGTKLEERDDSEGNVILREMRILSSPSWKEIFVEKFTFFFTFFLWVL